MEKFNETTVYPASVLPEEIRNVITENERKLRLEFAPEGEPEPDFFYINEEEVSDEFWRDFRGNPSAFAFLGFRYVGGTYYLLGIVEDAKAPLEMAKIFPTKEGYDIEWSEFSGFYTKDGKEVSITDATPEEVAAYEG